MPVETIGLVSAVDSEVGGTGTDVECLNDELERGSAVDAEVSGTGTDVGSVDEILDN